MIRLCALSVVLLFVVGSAYGLPGSSLITCPGKIDDECGNLLTTDLDKNDRRAYCCHAARHSRCVEMAIEANCPDTLLSALSGLIKSVPDTGACDDYTFWSPQCIYSNYLLILVGTSVGIAALVVGLCVLCCCCCCRKK